MKRNGEVDAKSNTKQHPAIFGRRGLEGIGAQPAGLEIKKDAGEQDKANAGKWALWLAAVVSMTLAGPCILLWIFSYYYEIYDFQLLAQGKHGLTGLISERELFVHGAKKIVIVNHPSGKFVTCDPIWSPFGRGVVRCDLR